MLWPAKLQGPAAQPGVKIAPRPLASRVRPASDTPGRHTRRATSTARHWKPSAGQPAIARAVPAGSRRARSQREFLAALIADPALAELRADARRVVTECARVWARHASWSDRTTRPTRRRVCDLVGSDRVHRGCPGCAPGAPCRRHPLSAAAYKTARRWLESHGYLGLVSAGSTPAFRPGVLSRADDANEAAVHLLTIPHRRPRTRPAECADTLIRPPSRSRSDPDESLCGREAKPEVKPRKARAPRGLPVLPRPGTAALRTCPKSRSDGLTAAGVLQLRSREMARLSPAMIRPLCRPFFTAARPGTPADVLAAID